MKPIRKQLVHVSLESSFEKISVRFSRGRFDYCRRAAVLDPDLLVTGVYFSDHHCRRNGKNSGQSTHKIRLSHAIERKPFNAPAAPHQAILLHASTCREPVLAPKPVVQHNRQFARMKCRLNFIGLRLGGIDSAFRNF
jgi:hypothetical protein